VHTLLYSETSLREIQSFPLLSTLEHQNQLHVMKNLNIEEHSNIQFFPDKMTENVI